MADKKISQLPSGNLDSNTIFPIVSSGVTSQTTLGDLQSAIGGGTSNHYIIGWEIEKERGTTATIGLGKGKITLTNGSNEVLGIDGVIFSDIKGFDSPYSRGQISIVSTNLDGRRYIQMDDYTDDTHGTLSEVFYDNRLTSSIGNVWDGPTGDYEYYAYLIGESSTFSFAEGQATQAFGFSTHAEGYQSYTSGDYSHAEGQFSQANGIASHAEGYNTQANGDSSHAEGQDSIASGYVAHAEGNSTLASGFYSHSEGHATIASGEFSHAEGRSTLSSGENSHAQGRDTTASGQSSHAGGENTNANGMNSFVHGNNSVVNGDYSIILGRNITGNQNDTTYVDNLNVKTLGGGLSVNNLGIDANGFVVTGTKIGATAPASATDTGITGEIRVSAGFIYWCTAPNTWIRAAGATW